MNGKDEIHIPFPTIEDAQKQVDESPDSFQANAILGELLYEAKRYKDAIGPLTIAAKSVIPKLNELETTEPKDVLKSPRIGSMFLSVKKFREIAHSIMMMLGHAHYNSGSKGDAVQWLDNALEIKKDNPDSWNFYAIVQSESGNFDGALVAFREAVRINPSRRDFWQNLQITYKNLQRPEARLILPVLEKKRNIEDDIETLIDLYIHGAEYERAHNLIDMLLEWNQNDVRAMRVLGRLCIIEGVPDQLISYTEAALKNTSDHPDLLWNLARAKCIVGTHKDSKKILKKLLKAHSNHRNAQVLLHSIDSCRGKRPLSVGLIVLLEHTFESSDGENESLETSNELAYYADLTPPLGSTIEDLLHILHRGETKRITKNDHLKRVNLTWMKHDNRINMTVSGLPGSGHEFKYIEPASKIIQFMETGRERKIRPVGEFDDILVSGDIIACKSCDKAMQEGMQLVAWYRILMEKAQEKLKHWRW